MALLKVATDELLLLLSLNVYKILLPATSRHIYYETETSKLLTGFKIKYWKIILISIVLFF